MLLYLTVNETLVSDLINAVYNKIVQQLNSKQKTTRLHVTDSKPFLNASNISLSCEKRIK